MRGISLTTADSLELWLASAPTSTQPTFHVAYLDVGVTTVPGGTSGVFTGVTHVTALAAPSSGKRIITGIYLFNGDTVGCRAFAGCNTSGTVTTLFSRFIAPSDDTELISPKITPQGDMTKAEYDADGDGILDAAVPVTHASSHAAAGADPITPLAIGAAQPQGTITALHLAYFYDAVNQLAAAGQLYFDPVNKRFGIGAAPLGALYVCADGATPADPSGITITDAIRKASMGIQGTDFAYILAWITGATFAAGISSASGHPAFMGSSTATNVELRRNNIALLKLLDGYVNLPLGTASRALVLDATKNIVASDTTAAELSFVHGVTAAIQDQLAGKASLSGGYVPVSQLPAEAVRVMVSGNVRVATFGSSKANACSTSSNFDIENLIVPFPGSGVTAVQFTRYYTLAGIGRYQLVANGGIDSTGTQAFLDRSKAAPSATRKALPDIVSKRPHVVLFHGGSINDIGTATAYSYALVVAVAERHRQCVRVNTQAGIHVVDSGIDGYSVDGPYLAIRRQMLLEINTALAALAALDPLWHWVEPSGLTHDGTGAFYSGYSDDGVHLNNLGNYMMGLAEKAVVDRYFVSVLPSAPYYDFQQDFANVGASAPAKMSRDLGGATANSMTCTAELYTVNFTAASTLNVLMFVSAANMKTVLSGGLTGDRFILEIKAWLENTDGTLVSGSAGTSYTTRYDTANALGVVTTWRTQNSGLHLLNQFSLPCNAADLGTSSNMVPIALSVPAAGTYNFKMEPPRIFKIS